MALNWLLLLSNIQISSDQFFFPTVFSLQLKQSASQLDISRRTQSKPEKKSFQKYFEFRRKLDATFPGVSFFPSLFRFRLFNFSLCLYKTERMPTRNNVEKEKENLEFPVSILSILAKKTQESILDDFYSR